MFTLDAQHFGINNAVARASRRRVDTARLITTAISPV